jgi:uncharacterized protein (TIGR02391 family)
MANSHAQIMNLETKLPDPLWEAVRQNYEKHDFTGSILDAMYFLSDLLRKKSGLEGDGAALVGQAFGGASPKIKLNRLQSESDWNVQRGFEQLLRGFYQAIRNPRSHEKLSDREEDAQVLILFVGYLVRQIDQAKAQFSTQDFVKRVLDPDFVPQRRYAELLVAEVPPGARMEVFLAIYRSKENWKPESIRHFFEVLFEVLSDDEKKQAYEILSEEMKAADDETTVRLVIGSFKPDVWSNLQEAPRLRVEHRLVRAMREGRYSRVERRCRGGALGTWATGHFGVFLLKKEALRALMDKLSSNVEEEEDYVFEYFFSHMKLLSPTMPSDLDSLLRCRLKSGNQRFHDALFFNDPWGDDNWTDDLKKAMESFQANQPTNDPDDNMPF